jgi:hypothetical protein
MPSLPSSASCIGGGISRICLIPNPASAGFLLLR